MLYHKFILKNRIDANRIRTEIRRNIKNMSPIGQNINYVRKNTFIAMQNTPHVLKNTLNILQDIIRILKNMFLNQTS